MTIVAYFDPHNIEHIKAYRYLTTKGEWPKDFLPKNIDMTMQWQVGIMSKLASAWVEEFLK